ncbi:uncharacterized protein LOC116306965 [Actinia tenebrosa]|uniref:Uncharacterized protein LOC116306965 n=1 Tax=Actinia tenebrosa TaxID=6105 RepID=A0A6P8J4P1_ACTTE|nr:uncharacterized protein LOC116306965 [Actinia tenebrosa]
MNHDMSKIKIVIWDWTVRHRGIDLWCHHLLPLLFLETSEQFNCVVWWEVADSSHNYKHKMSGLSIGLSTFNSCNKAGSIPHFTQHLTLHPNDYRALTWRGRALSIVGKAAEAKADFQKACRVSDGPKKLLAQAHLMNIDGNMQQKVAILQNTTRQYPNCSEAWHDLGSHTYQFEGTIDPAFQFLGRANRLATINSETEDPWYPWCNQTIGDIYFHEKRQVNDAREHYATAVQSSNTLTVGHLGLSRCEILNNNLARAETSFLTAKRLNPVLVTWESFDEFRQQFMAQHAVAGIAFLVSEFSKVLTNFTTDDQQYSANGGNTRSQSGYQGGGSGGRGNGGSGDGSGSDDEDMTPENLREREWTRIKKEAPSAKKYRGKKFYQSKCKRYWYSKIAPAERHGTEVKSFLKKYADKGRTIELMCSIDENMDEMHGKHESGKYAVIKKSDMDGMS